jgi:hypothetical protein
VAGAAQYDNRAHVTSGSRLAITAPCLSPTGLST